MGRGRGDDAGAGGRGAGAGGAAPGAGRRRSRGLKPPAETTGRRLKPSRAPQGWEGAGGGQTRRSAPTGSGARGEGRGVRRVGAMNRAPTADLAARVREGGLRVVPAANSFAPGSRASAHVRARAATWGCPYEICVRQARSGRRRGWRDESRPCNRSRPRVREGGLCAVVAASSLAREPLRALHPYEIAARGAEMWAGEGSGW
jgi:hypothetical protein